VCMWGGTSGREEGEQERLRWQYMFDGIHIPIWNRTEKSLAIAVSAAGEGWEGEMMGEM
jgi:hypothetical protein